MAVGGRQYPLKLKTTTRSPIFIFTLALLALFLLYFIVSSRSSQPPAPLAIHPSQNPTVLNPRADYAFVVSLEKFLTTKSPPPPQPDDTHLHDVNKLDDSLWIAETRRIYDHPSPPQPLRVYVYQMPSKFTYDLLLLFRNTYRDTSNLTSNGSPVHRLIEQHSIDYWLWADLIAPQSERLLKDVVVRVHRQEEADLFYIPFFTTISFFLLEKQQCKALYRVKL